MLKKLTSLMMVTSFLLLMFWGLESAMADEDYGPDCDRTVSSGGSIQAVIDDAEEGDIICVELDTYVEDLSIIKELELVGLKDTDDDANRPVIKGEQTVPGSSFPLALPNIDIQANNVSIHGFIIESPEVAADTYSSGIVLTGRNIRIYDNHFVVATGDVSQAIQTWRQNNAPEGLRDISGLRIYKNSFTHLTPASGYGAYEGIFINPQSDSIDPSDPASAVIIEKNKFSGALIRAITTQRSGTVISKNRIRTDWSDSGFSTFPRGIQLSQADENTPEESTGHKVIKNKIEKKGAAFSVGILVSKGVKDSIIEKNKVTGTLDYGVKLETSEYNSVEKNQIKFSESDGLYVNGRENKLIKNIIKNSGGYGIHLDEDSALNSVVKNKVKKSGDEDIFDKGIGNSFEKNICSSSTPDSICRKSKKK